MRFHDLHRRLKVLWKKRLVRGIAALLITTGVVLLQFRLANIPLPVQIGNSSETTIPPIRFGEELVIGGPASGSTLLLGHNGDATEIVDFYLENATITQETRRSYDLDPRAQLTPGRLSYTTQPAESSRIPCTTDVEARLLDEKRPPREIRFFQSPAPGNQSHREINVRVDQDVLLVVGTNPTESPPEEDSDDDGPGCVKRLEGTQLKEKEKQKILAGAFTIESNIRANSSIMMRFLPIDAGKPIWTGNDGFVEPFRFTSPILRSTHISIRSSDNSAPFEIIGSEKGDPLRVNALRIGSDQLRADVSGKGFVRRDGEMVTLKLVERIQQYPFFAALFAMLNAGLLAWLTRLVRGLFHS